MISTIKELTNYFWELEEKLDLVNFNIDNTKPYLLIRQPLFIDVAVKLGLFNSPPHKRLSKKEKFLKGFNLLFNSMFHNTFIESYKADILIHPHERVKKIDGEYVDIYTHYFEKELIEKNVNFIELEKPFLGKHYKIKTKYRIYEDFLILLRYLIKIFIKVKFSKKQLEKIKEIEKFLKKDLNVEIDLVDKIKDAIKTFKADYVLYKIILKKINPQKVYLVVSYGKQALIKACKDLNIEVIEFQHGTIFSYHMGYNFPYLIKNNNIITPEYFPDKILIWSEFWKKVTFIPIPEEKIEIFPFLFLNRYKDKYKHLKKDAKNLIVISQGTITDEIASKIIDNWDYFKNFNILYKLHPGEYEKWQNSKNLLKLSKYGNVNILKDEDLYKLFSISKYVVGVYSTAIFEALEFNCEIILLNVSGIEYMEDFIKIYNPKIF